ncbi:MAG: GNAT family N-acetyltransferase, partial [Anaerolineales bacterium]
MPLPETVTLRSGARAILRPIRPDDAARLQAFHQRLSSESIYLRWLSAHPILTDAEAADLTELDYSSRMAFVAVVPPGAPDGHPGPIAPGEIIGVARYAVAHPARPLEVEAAVVVADAYQRQGLGSQLLQRLLTYSQARGITTWVAEINAQNVPMLRFIGRGGLPVTRRLEGGSWQVS